MKTFLTSDWHLGDSRAFSELGETNILQRPFRSIEETLDVILRNHNDMVTPKDLVIVAGDVVCDPKYLPKIQLFSGEKILIRGNHDKQFTDEQLSPFFSKIIPEGDGLVVEHEGIRYYVTHYPSTGSKQYFNLVGHVHSCWKHQKNMMNIGVDVHHFYPVPISTIPFHTEAIAKYYDEDIWAAYNPINTIYNNRGKKGIYFKVKK